MDAGILQSPGGFFFFNRVRITYYPTRVADHYRACWHIVNNDRSSPNHCLISYANARKNGRVGANRCVILDDGLRKATGVSPRARKKIIGEARVRTDKNAVTESHPIPQLNAALDCNGIANDDVILDKHVVANITVAPDMRAAQDMRKGPDARAFSNIIGFANACSVNEDRHATASLLKHDHQMAIQFDASKQSKAAASSNSRICAIGSSQGFPLQRS